MKHKHDFQITIREILSDGNYKITAECACGEELSQINATGDWLRI